MQKIRSALTTVALCGMLSTTILPASAAPKKAAGDFDAAALRDKALNGDTVAWDVVEGITTEVGPRPAATPQEANARTWAVAKLKSLGFSNVHIEDYMMPGWVRGAETGSITAPFPQPLHLTALGNSGATPADGIEAEVVYFPTFADLAAAPDGSLTGKIAFVSHAMHATQDGSSYGEFGVARRQGPSVAAKKGAIGIVIRSIGTDHHRVPHTGVQMWADGVTPIPAAALSVPDAELLARMFERGKPVRLKMTLTPRFTGQQPSGNVIAEVPGSDPKAGIIMITGHLDSWDLGTGAIDDGAGVAIITAAAKTIMDAGKPRRTIRLLLAGAEEVGSFGGKAYFEAHKGEPHVLTSESDFGADRVWRADFRMPDSARGVADRIAQTLSPLGIGRGQAPAGGGADNAEFVRTGVPVIDLQQDGTRYFDIHHTADDTLDKIDLSQLRQNVAAWVSVLAIAANAPELDPAALAK